MGIFSLGHVQREEDMYPNVRSVKNKRALIGKEETHPALDSQSEESTESLRRGVRVVMTPNLWAKFLTIFAIQVGQFRLYRYAKKSLDRLRDPAL